MRLSLFPEKDVQAARSKVADWWRENAKAIRRQRWPVVLRFAHEMNGHWYPWGAHRTDPADFVAAWRHIHDVFRTVGATNVIWTWTPARTLVFQVLGLPSRHESGDGPVDGRLQTAAG